MRFWTVVVTLMLVAGCSPSPQDDYQPALGSQGLSPIREYRVGIHPLHNPQRLMDIYGPIVDDLNAGMPGIELKLEASRNYEEFEKKLYAGHFDFAMPNPYQTVLALKHGYRVIGKMADDTDFRGLILLRKASKIRTVADLKGQSIAYPAPTALAATLLPQNFLHSQGLDVNRDVVNLYVGSQESAIASVLRGHVAAAATWTVPWRSFMEEHPDQANHLVVKWQTQELPNNGWVARQDLPDALVRRFAGLLFSLQDSEAGRQMLQRVPVSRFEPASNETYRPVRVFLEHFAKTVHPIEY